MSRGIDATRSVLLPSNISSPMTVVYKRLIRTEKLCHTIVIAASAINALLLVIAKIKIDFYLVMN